MEKIEAIKNMIFETSEVINLDAGESIQTIKINDIDYKIGELPGSMIKKVLGMDTKKAGIYEERKPILFDILKIKNKDVQDHKYWSDEKTVKLASFIINKILNDKKS